MFIKKFLFCCLSMFSLLEGACIPLSLEHAISPEQRNVGLMGRNHLPTDHGMLFHFSADQQHSFWMYNTLIDLSIAFLDKNSSILEIYELHAYPNVKEKSFFFDKILTSKAPFRYALEMNKNWFSTHGIKPGDSLLWDMDSKEGYILINNKKNHE